MGLSRKARFYRALIVLSLCFSTLSAAPSCRIRWRQRMPLTDASFGVQPSLKPVLSDSFVVTVPFDAEVLRSGDDDCQHDFLTKAVALTLDPLSFVPQQCSCSACSLEELAQWREVAPSLLPQGRVVLDANGDPAATSVLQGNMMVAFHSLPIGRAFVFESEVTISCPMVTQVRFAQGETSVDGELVVVIRPAVPEYALVTDRYELLRGAKDKVTAASVHRRNLRGGSGPSERTVMADVEELSLNRDGLWLRVLLLGDRFQLRNLSSHCRKRLGSSPLPRRHVDECTRNVEELDGVDEGSEERCAHEHTAALRDLQLAIAEGFSCSPLPCLHENPLFNVGHLAAPDASTAGAAVEAEHSIHAPQRNYWAQEILVRTHTANAAVTINAIQLDEALNAHPILSPRPLSEVASRWNALVSAAQADGGLPRIIRPSDVRVAENLAVVEIPAQELRARGFFLPSYRHLGWRFGADRGAAVPAELDALGREWIRHIGGERSVFQVTLTLPTWSTTKRSSQRRSSGDRVDAPANEEAEQGTLSSRILSMVSLDNSALTPRGALSSSITEPYPSLRYTLKYRDAEKGDHWEEIPLTSYFPVELAAFTPLLSEGTSSPSDRHQFGIFAPHFRDGFDLILAPGSKDELMIRHRAAFLQCPPRPATCAGYYGSWEGPFAAFFQKDWITRVESSPVFRKVLVLYVSAIPSHLRAADFGKPVHIGIRLPQGTTRDDGQYPLPLNATTDHRSWYSIQFVPPRSSPAPLREVVATGNDRHEEL